MDPRTELFERHRSRLFGLAYRMLGTPADAEDVLHDAWLRLHGEDVAGLDDPEAWLVTVTTRLALDRLRRAKAERAHYTGPWLPEPLVPDAEHPDAALERSESLTLSFLLLERLGPEERAAFLLHEVFDYSHAEAAAILGVAEDAIHISDGGGVARATLRPLHGAERLARLYLQLGRNLGAAAGVRYEFATLNGAPALFMLQGDTLFGATWIECDGERITAIHTLRHPGKLARLRPVTNPPPTASLH